MDGDLSFSHLDKAAPHGSPGSFARSIGREDHADIELGRRRGTAGRMVRSLSTPDITRARISPSKAIRSGEVSLTNSGAISGPLISASDQDFDAGPVRITP
jgi:hypothetical protein